MISILLASPEITKFKNKNWLLNIVCKKCIYQCSYEFEGEKRWSLFCVYCKSALAGVVKAFLNRKFGNEWGGKSVTEYKL